MQTGRTVKVKYTKQFYRKFRKLESKVKKSFRKNLGLLFDTYPYCPNSLNIKKLKRGNLNQHSFRVTLDYRVIFIKEKDILELSEILSHEEFDKKYGS
jgi:mRNA-degrading endonuclease RelE of RelBE toxin-antitoxin system